jgi:type IV secretory pathway VirB3-like protein
MMAIVVQFRILDMTTGLVKELPSLFRLIFTRQLRRNSQFKCMVIKSTYLSKKTQVMLRRLTYQGLATITRFRESNLAILAIMMTCLHVVNKLGSREPKNFGNLWVNTSDTTKRVFRNRLFRILNTLWPRADSILILSTVAKQLKSHCLID